MHLSRKAKKSFLSIIRTLFTIAFLVYTNDHTCLPVFWCFFKFSRLLTHSRQLTHSFFVQCLQHFKSDFVLTSSVSGIQSSYGCCHFCKCEDLLFLKINRIACVNGCYPYLVQQIYAVFSPCLERISFSSLTTFPVESLL